MITAYHPKYSFRHLFRGSANRYRKKSEEDLREVASEKQDTGCRMLYISHLVTLSFFANKKGYPEIRMASNDCLPYEKNFNYFFTAESTFLARLSILAFAVSPTALTVESTFATVESTFAAAESTLASVLDPPPHAAKEPIANTNNNFFM